ncbi:MAG: ATP-dependent Clp protease adapter ClpS [Spirochaetaceae bacterium]|nr:MAG: ATP-dependent Clp protease adapter ClpS [Spirochaetaceae bacterium]
MGNSIGFSADHASSVKEKSSEKVKEPDMYQVILHNDDFTTMEFVIEVLMKVFHQTMNQATQIMLSVHERGQGRVGVYTYDIASTKAQQAMTIARKRQYPLKVTVEKI